jgi:hypothetical protein
MAYRLAGCARADSRAYAACRVDGSDFCFLSAPRPEAAVEGVEGCRLATICGPCPVGSVCDRCCEGC